MLYTVYALALDGSACLAWAVSEELVARMMALALRRRGATTWYVASRPVMDLDA
jgi:hypothetical protein